MSSSTQWRSQLPALACLSPSVSEAFDKAARVVRHRSGTTVCTPVSLRRTLCLLVRGRVRLGDRVVSAAAPGTDDVGRAGAALAAACILQAGGSLGDGIADGEVTGIALPVATYEALVDGSPEFRGFLFTAYAGQIAGMITLGRSPLVSSAEANVTHLPEDPWIN